MEKSSDVHPSHAARPTTVPRKDRERGALVPPKRQHPKASKAGRLPEASSVRKERPKKEKSETNEVTVEQETEVKVKSTVVDIDSVREKVNEENTGLLEAAEEDGESKLKECKIMKDFSMFKYVDLDILENNL